MLRRNFMKRLSKSASDLSGCKKKTHSTSPDEEEKDVVPFSTPTNVSDDEGHDGHTRPSSAASTRSVPEFPASSSGGKKSKPLTGTLTRKAKKLFKANKQQQPSEVGIRNVGGQIHSAYRGHQVSTFSASSSRFGIDLFSKMGTDPEERLHPDPLGLEHIFSTFSEKIENGL